MEDFRQGFRERERKGEERTALSGCPKEGGRGDSTE